MLQPEEWKVVYRGQDPTYVEVLASLMRRESFDVQTLQRVGDAEGGMTHELLVKKFDETRARDLLDMFLQDAESLENELTDSGSLPSKENFKKSGTYPRRRKGTQPSSDFPGR